MTDYFREAIREQKSHPREGLINSFMTAEIDGDRLTEEEIIANCIVTMVGGQETTTNLIGNGVLTLIRNPDETQRLRDDLSLIPSAVEELLRYESPSQQTARICPEDTELGGKSIRKGQAVIAVMAAGNRVISDAGVVLQDLIDFSIERGLKGLETLAGIPGWVGAAVYGNAGAYGHSLSERVHKVRFFDEDQVRVFDNERGLTALQITFDEVAPTSGLVPQIQNRESGCPFHRSA